MGISIITDDKGVKVWRNDKAGFPKYAVQVSKKDGDHWINHYQDVKFKKGVELQNGEIIHIKDAFPSVDSWVKDGRQFTKEVWWILEFERESQDVPSGFDDFGFSSTNDSVPF